MGVEIVIVDDDPMVGNLSLEVLKDAGFSAELVTDSRLALSTVKDRKPRLVMLDILMPGIDGLSILHQIKSDPQTAQTKVAIVSAKTFKAEMERAKSYGADMFIKKPYDLKDFPKQIKTLIGEPQGKGGTSQKTTVKVRAWGRREADSTPCLCAEALGRLFILDASKGAAALGAEILKEGRHKEAWLLITHFHLDHVSGLGALPLLREESFHLHIIGPSEPEKKITALLKEAMSKSMGTDKRPIKAKIQVHEVREESYELAQGLRISPFYANHPTTTLGYVLELGGRRIVYCPDTELYGEAATALQDYDEKVGRMVRAADLLIHDGRYTDADYAQHRDEGHSSVVNAAEFAADNEVRYLLLIHADPSYPDAVLEKMEADAKAALEGKGVQIPCAVVRDGLALEI
ncbi:MAG: response regulator [Elusimicrobia bacterium]|nr:response regulator [Elusimicrobiota bacterium]